MRHIIVSGAMLLIALVVTFGTASVLQVVAQNQRTGEPTAVVEASKPAAKPTTANKERSGIHVRAASMAGF